MSKKLLAIVLVLAMTFQLTACGSNSEGKEVASADS